ncbi:variable surface protein [Plasmodium gonderi]|uniref:Variable surface protein n=1 Tax=Plasmodium gonderi TaxID=77519 RepID=A0A1Y1JST6_PLAGO|nr:variable surface protein [Plasmodium gonderi]GAW84515.1 variable surface protein [Plasmodium gonderi]
MLNNFFLLIILYQKILKEFPAHKKYEDFNTKSVNNEGEYIKLCNHFPNSNENEVNFCKRAVTILSDIFKIGNERDRDDSCVYFQHWFTDNIREKFSNDNMYFRNYNPSNYHYYVMNNVNYENKTKFKYICLISRDEKNVKVEKDLHDYFRNFYYIKCNGVDEKKCRMYYNYVKYIIPLYKQSRDKHFCCFLANGEVEDRCKHYFICDKIYDPQNLLNVLEGQINGSAWNNYTNNQNYEVYDENRNSYGSSFLHKTINNGRFRINSFKHRYWKSIFCISVFIKFCVVSSCIIKTI